MKYALITGGTSGIGYELARKFAKGGYGLVIVSSNLENLEAARDALEKESGATVETIRQDMCCLGAADEIYRKIGELGIPVSVLVNNAGYGLIGPADEINLRRDERMMILNVVNPTELCKLFLADMYRAGEGKILNVASTGAFQPGPYTSTYYASKAFILSFSRAIRFEAKAKGVQVSALCPGTTRTRFFEREGTLTPKLAMSAESVAEAAYSGLMRGKEIIVPGFINKFLRIVPVRIKIGAVAGLKTQALKADTGKK